MRRVAAALMLLVLVVARPAAGQETPQTGAPAEWPMDFPDAQVLTFVEADRLEARLDDGDEGLLLDAQGWIGTDAGKLWWKAEGDGRTGGGVESAEIQALYSRMITPFFDLQLGVRQDLAPDAVRTHAVVGIQGLAPYWFEVDAALFLAHTGDVTARVEAEYDLLLTQRLVLQPRTEVRGAFQDVDDLGIGAGLSSAELGLRLRYEITRRVAPYVGVSWHRRFGGTAEAARAGGQDAGSRAVVAGIRLWH